MLDRSIWLLASCAFTWPLILTGCDWHPPGNASDHRAHDRADETGPARVATSIEAPSPPGAMAPNLAFTNRGAILSWLEPLGEGGHALRVSRLDPASQSFGPASTVVEGDDFFANWADFPGFHQDTHGALYGHWLRKTSTGTYAYSIALARADDGANWSTIGWLHDDLSWTEHGFVSYASTDTGLAAFWLDGREMDAPGGAMGLRARFLSETTEQPSPAMPDDEEGALELASGTEESVLDDRVCECCQTDAANTSRGPIVVYRNRSENEIRDIWQVRREGSGWSEPAPVAEDGWKIGGCPVNGPAIAADGDTVAVAWFTAADDRPRVQLALSGNAGKTWGPPILLDQEEPVGRVDVAVSDSRAWVSWLGRSGDGGAVRIREIAIDRDGERIDPSVASQPIELGKTGAARNAGFPRLLRQDNSLLVAWVETGDPARIRVASISVEE